MLEVLNASCQLCILLLPLPRLYFLPLLVFTYTILPLKFSSGIISPQEPFPDNLISPSPFTDGPGYMSSLCSHNSLHINPNTPGGRAEIV